MAERLTAAVVMAGSAGALEVMFDQVRRLVQPDNSSLFLLYHRGDGAAADWSRVLPKDSGFVAKPLNPGQPVTPGTVYYPDSGVTYGVVAGRIEVVGEDLRPSPNLDASLAALAREYGPRLVAVLLSGWGSDGVNGMKVVRQAGGTAIIQDPKSAEVEQLPKTAVAHGVAHKVMDPASIVRKVERVLRGAYGAAGPAKAKPKPGSRPGSGRGGARKPS
ncbi:MAG: two-component system, chemotaxis family, protein-glutamate methylesterase/glutaminase [Thermoplasmata archaeon]|jgi:chemotaxis response regulator CheB|nr:two-component system, chemotaxis family, protein-glutamate methylesterase/glutaminase [Thermoplasmata archaeon]